MEEPVVVRPGDIPYTIPTNVESVTLVAHRLLAAILRTQPHQPQDLATLRSGCCGRGPGR